MRNNKEKAHFEEKRKERERARGRREEEEEREREGAWLYLWNLIIELIFSRYFHFIIYGH